MNTAIEARSPLDRPLPDRLRVVASERHGIRNILVCLDQSSSSEECLPYAIFVAKAFHGSLTLLHVLEPPHRRSSVHAFDSIEWELSRQEADSYLKRLEEEVARQGIKVESRIEEGHPAERIRSVAREFAADLTVLTPYGEGKLAGWNLGSTAQQVLARPQGSVLITHSANRQKVFAPKRILVPLDGSVRTESTLPTAVRIAKESGAELLLVHVVPELAPSGMLRSAEDLGLAAALSRRLESQAHRYLNDMRDGLAREVPSVTVLVSRHADQAQALLDLSGREHIDLIVLSAHGSTCNSERSFGSFTTHLLTHSTVPLLVLQDLRESEIARSGDRKPLVRSSLSASSS
jgi:nucleotide-binding universal stress UspA family protein